MAPHVEVVMSTRCSIHKYILGLHQIVSELGKEKSY